jgi:hypothetical protein
MWGVAKSEVWRSKLETPYEKRSIGDKAVFAYMENSFIYQHKNKKTRTFCPFTSNPEIIKLEASCRAIIEKLLIF